MARDTLRELFAQCLTRPASGRHNRRRDMAPVQAQGQSWPVVEALELRLLLSSAWALTTLHSFPSYPNAGTDDANSCGGLVRDGQGNLYGTTCQDGNADEGTVFEISANGTSTTLHTFTSIGTDGGYPYSGVALDEQGNLYGTTGAGGSANRGTVYKISANGTFSTLYSFSGGADGAAPQGVPAVDGQGNVYGTTSVGGGIADAGTVFEISANGTFTTLHSFNQSDGDGSRSGLILDGQGNLYGTTADGGVAREGNVFEISADGTFIKLHDFLRRDGGQPIGNLTLDAQGNLYGTTTNGGSDDNGTVFRISASGTFTLLHSFLHFNDNDNSGCPIGDLAIDGQGNVFGTAGGGGIGHSGTIFEISASGVFTMLYSFTGGIDGGFPWSGVILDGQGSLYGTTSQGGAHRSGTVFELSYGRVRLGGSTTFVRYTDADGTAVTVRLTGGAAQLTFEGEFSTPPKKAGRGLLVTGSGVQLENVDLLTNSSAGRLAFTTTGGTIPGATIGSITNSPADASFGNLSGPTIDLVGNGISLSGAGAIGSISLRSLQNGAGIVMPGAAPTGVTLVVGKIANGTDINLSGGLKRLTVGDWNGTGSLEAAWVGKISAAGEVQDVSVTTNGAINSLVAAQWDGGSIRADSLHNLSINGRRANVAKKTGYLAGDFEAGLSLLALQVQAGQKTLASGKVAGNVGGTVGIAGDVGRLSAGTLSGQLTIDGQAVVKLNNLLSINPPAGGSVGQLHIAGQASVTGGKQKFKFSGDDLYTVVNNTYSLADLLNLSSPGFSGNYDFTSAGNGQSDSGVLTMAVASAPDSIGASDAYGLGLANGSELEMEGWWLTSGGQTQLAQWWLNTRDMGQSEMTFTTPLAVPDDLAVGQNYSSTSMGITGQWPVNMGDESTPDWQTINVTSGTATMIASAAGVEQIIVNGSAYLAVKLTITLKMSGAGEMDYNGSHAATYNVTDNETIWAVPGGGVVQMTSSIRMNGSLPGSGSGSFSTKTTLTLQ